MQSDIVQRLDYWRNEMQRTIQALESNPKFSDVVDGNRSIHTTLGMAKTEILFSRTTIANQTEAMRASDAEITRLTEALRAAEDQVKGLRDKFLNVADDAGETYLGWVEKGCDPADAIRVIGWIEDFARRALKGPSHDQ